MGMFAAKKTALPQETIDDLLRMVPIGAGTDMPQPQQQQMPDQPPTGLMQSPAAAMPSGTINPEADHKANGFFGSNGMGKALLGGLFDSILSQTGGQPINIPSMVRKQQLAAQDARDQRKRQDEFTDFTKQWDYQGAHPKPTQPGEFEQRLIASGVQPGTPEWTAAMKTSVTNTLDPFTNLVVGGNSVFGRQSQVMNSLGGGGQASGPPAGAVDYLRKNPGTATQFDQKYGAGASRTILGGY